MVQVFIILLLTAVQYNGQIPSGEQNVAIIRSLPLSTYIKIQCLNCPIQVTPTLPFPFLPSTSSLLCHPFFPPHPLFINGCELCHRYFMQHLSRDNPGAYCFQLDIIFPLTEQTANQDSLGWDCIVVSQRCPADCESWFQMVNSLFVAFNTITHQILLTTGLHCTGLNRTSSEISTAHKLRVPQGFVIRPLLSSIYS